MKIGPEQNDLRQIPPESAYTYSRENYLNNRLATKTKKPPAKKVCEQALLDEISDLKRQLVEARENNLSSVEHQHELAKIMRVGFWEWDEINNRALSYSAQMAEIFDVDEADIHTVLQGLEDFEPMVHPDDLEHYRKHISGNLKQDKTYSYEYRIIHRDGGVRYLREHERGVFDTKGKLISSYGAVHDITESELVVDSLKQSETRYATLFEEMPLGMQEENYTSIKKIVDKLIFKGVKDISGYLKKHPQMLRDMVAGTTITSVNQALIDIHEANSKEDFIEDEADIDNWWDADWVLFYAEEIGALAGERRYFEAERIDSKIDGSYFETRSITQIVGGYEDNWERVITIHEEITTRKKAEADLIEAKTQAEQANLAKSEFLSSMSHELRTPLNAILGFSQLFQYDRSVGEQHLANATEINRAGKHLMSLIDQILDLSRIEAGEVAVSLEPVSLRQVLTDSVNWIAPLAKNREIEVDYDYSQFEDLVVLADSIRLKQVFLNLLTNAVKYNYQSGNVSVNYQHLGNGTLRIGISDTGPGLSADKLKELFQPFNRLGAEFSGIEGSGIGLVITRQLLDLMNGKLEIESEPGNGSTFWVHLNSVQKPLKVDAEDPLDSTLMDTTPFDIHGPRILVAEDNLINQELMAAQLTILGYQADYAEDGVQALEQWQHGDYKLLLTDIRMPEMNGYELVREIRQLEVSQKRRSAVIAITANALDADVEKCFQAGVDDVIAKPVELEDLRDALEKWNPAKDVDFAAKPEDMKVGMAVDSPVDLNVLKQSTGDKPDLHQRLLKTFQQTLPDAISDIDQAFSWKSDEQIAEHTHKLKSSSRSLGALALAQACEKLEAAARQSDWGKIEALVPQLKGLAQEVEHYLESYLGDAPEQLVGDEIVRDFNLELPDDDITQFSLKLLLVDDDYIMHRVTTVMLNDLGVSGVLNAMSGPAALEVLADDFDSIDVVICDLNMPGMDGVEFIRHLAKRKFSGSVILTSGEDLRILKTVEKLAIEHDLHVLGVLEKPPAPAKLSELLDSLDQIQSEGTMMMVDVFTLQELEHAIANDELDTYFQPKINIEDDQVIGVEALVRWNHPIKGLIKPNSFIAMAEDNGLIGDLTDLVFNKALDYSGQLKQMGHDLNVAINISVDTLTDLEWPDHIAARLEDSGLDASSISFEITETRLMDHLSVALDILSRLSLKQFNLSIDDFGTGYSSMEQLQRIPFTEFKIDRAFVHGASRDTSARAILESSVLLGKKLDMKVVAEGVENQEDWDLVVELGCDQVQGYIVSRPLPFPTLVEWLDERKKSK